jgi:hypothetical protein
LWCAGLAKAGKVNSIPNYAEAELGVHGLTLPLAELYEDIVFPE